MIQIAICDDDEGCCSQIERWLMAYMLREKVDIEISIFNSAETLLKLIQDENWYDMVFLDIELPRKTGVELGKELRKFRQNNTLYIVYISGKTEYCMELFDTEPLNFHHKPLKEEDIISDIEKVMVRNQIGRQALIYKEDGLSKGILLKDIVYMGFKNKKVEIVLGNKNKVIIRESLNALEERYVAFGFCRCHRSYLVNLDYVRIYYDRKLTLTNGIVLDVGEKYAGKLKAALVKYRFVEE